MELNSFNFIAIDEYGKVLLDRLFEDEKDYIEKLDYRNKSCFYNYFRYSDDLSKIYNFNESCSQFVFLVGEQENEISKIIEENKNFKRILKIFKNKGNNSHNTYYTNDIEKIKSFIYFFAGNMILNFDKNNGLLMPEDLADIIDINNLYDTNGYEVVSVKNNDVISLLNEIKKCDHFCKEGAYRIIFSNYDINFQNFIRLSSEAYEILSKKINIIDCRGLPFLFCTWEKKFNEVIIILKK